MRRYWASGWYSLWEVRVEMDEIGDLGETGLRSGA